MARRASELFLAMQGEAAWFKPDAATKTELAAPEECRKGDGIS